MIDRFSREERAVVEMITRYAEAELAPAARAIDESGEFVSCHLPKLAELGIMGMNLPERWGGAGISTEAMFAGIEAIAGACGSTASMVTAHFLATDSILLGGNDEICGRYLADAAAGRSLGAFALTEPRAGSNPADMRTRAARVADGYRLKGVKHFISNGAKADFIIVFAITDPDSGHRGISAFVVDRETSGVEAGTAEKTMGLKGGHIFELSFDCVVPEINRLGPEGSGFKTAMKVLDNGRIEVSAMCIGIAQAALDLAVAWARERQIGGVSLSGYQGIQWMLADMATQLQAARLLAKQAVLIRQHGDRFTREASMAKLFCSEMAAGVTDNALQIHGGYGYTREMPLERFVRDVRVMRIYEGSSEIQRDIIAHNLFAQYNE
jgi:butyryl-CoA dehydrogenase